MRYERGDVFIWMGCHVMLCRIDREQTQADVFVLQLSTGQWWTKTQDLPLPSTAVKMPTIEHIATIERQAFDRGFANACFSMGVVPEAVERKTPAGELFNQEMDYWTSLWDIGRSIDHSAPDKTFENETRPL